MEQQIKLRQERDLGEKINVTFDFIRQNFKPLFKSLIYIVGPVLIILGILSSIMQINTMGNNTSAEQLMQSFSVITPLIFLGSLLSASLMISVVYGYMQLYLVKGPEPTIEVEEVWEVVKSNVLKIFITLILVGVIIVAGTFAFIIPGIILGIALSIIFAVQVVEDTDFGAAFGRSFTLMKGNYLSTFGLLFVMIIIQAIIGLIFKIPSLAVSGITGFLSVADSEIAFQHSPSGNLLIILAQLVSTVGSQLVGSISIIAVGFQYFNLVEKKEASGLMGNIDNLGNPED